MTLPGIPVSPVIEALRRALATYDRSIGDMGAGPIGGVIHAARAVLDEYDTQVAMVKAMSERAAVQAVVDQAVEVGRTAMRELRQAAELDPSYNSEGTAGSYTLDSVRGRPGGRMAGCQCMVLSGGVVNSGLCSIHRAPGQAKGRLDP